MALKRALSSANTPKVSSAAGDVDEVDDEVPDSIPRHKGDKRPKIRALDGSPKMGYYFRASSYGKVVESDYLLHRRDLRNVAFGMSRREDLVMAAALVPAAEDKVDEDRGRDIRNELQRIAAEAIVESKADLAAQRGTAFHKVSEFADTGADLSHLPANVRAAVEAWRRMMAGFTIHATETFIVWDEYRIGGSFDRLLSPIAPMTAPDGTVITPDDRLIADLKSGRTAHFFGAAYGVQQLAYASGTPYVHVTDEENAAGDNGRREWPDGIAPRTDWALIPHVPLDSPQDAGLMWVNLTDAAEIAEVARNVREAERLGKDLYFPAEIPTLAGTAAAPVESIAPAATGDMGEGLAETLLDMISTAVDEAALGKLYDTNAAVWTPAMTEAVKARVAALQAEAATPAAAPLQPAAESSAEDPILRAIAGATSVAAIGALYTAMSAKWTAVHGAAATARAAALEPAPAPAGEPAVDEAATDLVLGQLAAAPDEAALDALYLAHKDTWTAEHTEVVKARLVELDGAAA